MPDTAKTNSASLTTVKTVTSGTHEPATVPTTHDVPCKETQSGPLSDTEKTQEKGRPNRCSSREDEVQSPTDTRGVSTKDNAPDPPVTGDKKVGIGLVQYYKMKSINTSRDISF